MLLRVVVKIILDALVIFIFHWDVIGVASATVISNLVANPFYAFHIGFKSQFLSISVKQFKATKDILSNENTYAGNKMMAEIWLLEYR